MRMTEQEARDRWCPFSRSFDAAGGDLEKAGNVASGINRVFDGDVDPATFCIASDCMAWRWATQDWQREQTATETPPEGEGWKQSRSMIEDSRGRTYFWKRRNPYPAGYCGLAGNPWKRQ